MQTIKQFEQKANLPTKLIRATIRQCGGWESFKEIANDVATYGAAGGFNGFVYYTETLAFYAKNQKIILEYVESLANDMGESTLEFIAGFRCLDETQDTIARTLYGPKNQHDTQVANALVWFVLEETARSYSDLIEN